MIKNKEYILEYMQIHTELSKKEIAKEFKLSPATIGRWRREIDYSRRFKPDTPALETEPETTIQEPVQPQNDTDKRLGNTRHLDLRKPKIENESAILRNHKVQTKEMLANACIQNEKIEYECIRGCLWQSKLWEKGDVFFNEDALNVPEHFRPFDPENPIRTILTHDELLASVGHSRQTQHR